MREGLYTESHLRHRDTHFSFKRQEKAVAAAAGHSRSRPNPASELHLGRTLITASWTGPSRGEWQR